jgi:hypothetical protein
VRRDALRLDGAFIFPHLSRSERGASIQRDQLPEGPLKKLVPEAVVVDGHDDLLRVLVRGGRPPSSCIERTGCVYRT